MTVKKYKVTGSIHGHKRGDIIELSEKQIKSPVYASRVQPVDVQVVKSDGAEVEKLNAEIVALALRNDELALQLAEANTALDAAKKPADKPADKPAAK